jgi:hypothetical protein
MNLRRPKTFWTCLVLFVVGMVITVNIIRFNYPEFRPLAIFALATGIGFLAAGYGLWIMKKWGACSPRYHHQLLEIGPDNCLCRLERLHAGRHRHLRWDYAARDFGLEEVEMKYVCIYALS